MPLSSLIIAVDEATKFFGLEGHDWAALGALITAGATAAKVFWPAKSITDSHSDSKAQSHEITEVVDDSVLGRFEAIFEERITELNDLIEALRADLTQAQADLAQALLEIKELRKLEEYLQARLHEKDQELTAMSRERERNRLKIAELQSQLSEARDRIEHLEDVCRRAGINGDGGSEAECADDTSPTAGA